MTLETLYEDFDAVHYSIPGNPAVNEVTHYEIDKGDLAAVRIFGSDGETTLTYKDGMSVRTKVTGYGH